MPFSYPRETVIRAFGLIFDGVSADKASELMETFATNGTRSPSKQMISKWSQDGELTGGISWVEMRDTAKTIRDEGYRTVSKPIVRKKARDYKEWAEETLSDIDIFQDKIMEIVQTNKFTATLRDYLAVVRARHQIESLAIKVQDLEDMRWEIIGIIVRMAAGVVVHKFNEVPEVEKALYDFVEIFLSEITRMLQHGESLETFEIQIKQSPPVGLLDSWDQGEESS